MIHKYINENVLLIPTALYNKQDAYIFEWTIDKRYFDTRSQIMVVNLVLTPTSGTTLNWTLYINKTSVASGSRTLGSTLCTKFFIAFGCTRYAPIVADSSDGFAMFDFAAYSDSKNSTDVNLNAMAWGF